MESDLPQEKLIVGLISFGLGLILSGRFLLGLLSIAAGAYFYIKNRAAYRELEKRLLSRFSEPSPAVTEQKPEPREKKRLPDSGDRTAAAPVENWYYERAGAAIGPLMETDIRNLLLKSEITTQTLVYNPIFGDEWRKVENTHFAEIANRRSH